MTDLPILDLLDARGLAYKVDGDEARIVCPNAASHAGGVDNIASFNISLVGRGAHCFACGFSMRPDTVIRWLAGADLDPLTMESMAARALAARLRSGQPDSLYVPQHEVFMPRGDPWVTDYRGISAATYAKLGAVHVTRGRYENRIAFPIVVNGELVGVDARTLGDDVPKYLRNKNAAAQTNWLYPYDWVRELVAQGETSVLLGEGIFHGINPCDKGFAGLSFFGAHNFSMTKVRMLLALGVEEVIYFPDRDIAGEEAMHTVCKLIESWLPVTVADVSSLPLDEVATAKKGKPVFPDLGDLCAEDIRLCKTNRKRYSAGLSIL